MIPADTISEIKRWSVEDRLDLIEEVWTSIDQEEFVPPLTDELRTLLEQRLADAESNPDDVVTWEELKADLRRERLNT
ncbi:MAG: addiction module protein [Planctomycetaceae bacterium]